MQISPSAQPVIDVIEDWKAEYPGESFSWVAISLRRSHSGVGEYQDFKAHFLGLIESGVLVEVGRTATDDPKYMLASDVAEQAEDQDTTVTITIPAYDLKKLRKARELQKQIDVIVQRVESENRSRTREETDAVYQLYKEQDRYLAALGLSVMYDAPEDL